MVIERGLVVEALAPRGWIVLAAVAIGSVVFIALVVLLLVVGSNFDDPKNQTTVPPGSCFPFCTAGPPSEPPPPGWS